MEQLRVTAAAITIVIGCGVVVFATTIDFPLTDGDGGFVTPGMMLGAIFGGAPIITGLDAFKRRRGTHCGAKSCPRSSADSELSS